MKRLLVLAALPLLAVGCASPKTSVEVELFAQGGIVVVCVTDQECEMTSAWSTNYRKTITVKTGEHFEVGVAAGNAEPNLSTCRIKVDGKEVANDPAFGRTSVCGWEQR